MATMLSSCCCASWPPSCGISAAAPMRSFTAPHSRQRAAHRDCDTQRPQIVDAAPNPPFQERSWVGFGHHRLRYLPVDLQHKVRNCKPQFLSVFSSSGSSCCSGLHDQQERHQGGLGFLVASQGSLPARNQESSGGGCWRLRHCHERSALLGVRASPQKVVVFRCYSSKSTQNSTVLPEGATSQDAEFMRMAVELARKALGHTSPNPMVGCVIVKDGQIVGRGFHPKAGEPHAEVFALNEAGAKAQGATAYVSLEPCNHTGRTPPCSQALVRARVKRVVVGTVDPNPLVAGKGLETLRKAGIEVVVGVEEALCRATVETFMHRITTQKPFVTLRYSMSLDGALLGTEEDANIEPGSYYSLLLQEHDAIVVTDACIYDNPTLLSAEAGAKQPLRVVLARSLDMPLDSHVFSTALAPTLVLTDMRAILEDVEMSSRQKREPMESSLRSRGVDVVTMSDWDLDSVLDLLYQKGFNSVLFDSTGPELSGLESYLGQIVIAQQIAQKVVVAISPVIVGDKGKACGFKPDEILKLERVTTKVIGKYVILEAYFPKDSQW